MYPVTLIRISKNQNITVEMKNDETYQGILLSCDLYMNLHLKKVSSDQKNFKEVFLRGNSVKKIKLNKKVLFVQDIVENRKKSEESILKDSQE